MSIHMRKVTEAEIGPKQIKEEHLDDLAVSERTLQDDAVDTGKIKNAAITLAKSADDMRLHHFVGEESEVSVTGDVYEVVKTANFSKKAKQPSTKMRIITTLKTDNVLNTASLAIDIDAANKLELTTTEIAYELLDGEFDVSALADGKHLIEVKLKSSDVAGIASSDFIDIMIVK